MYSGAALLRTSEIGSGHCLCCPSYMYIHVERYKTISEIRTPLLIRKLPKGVHNDGEVSLYFCINH